MILHQYKRTYYNAKGATIGQDIHGNLQGIHIEPDILPTTTQYVDQLFVGLDSNDDKIYNGDYVRGFFGELMFVGQVVYDTDNFCFCLLTEDRLVRLSNLDEIEVI